MLKEALQYIVGLSDNKTYEIDGRTYSDSQLCLVDEPRYSPRELEVSGLDSICALITEEMQNFGKIYIQAESHNRVRAFTTYNDRFERYYLYNCRADVPAITANRFMTYETAIIQLRSLYIPNEDSEYLLKLLSSISNESKVTSTDNGVTQQVEAKSGIALSSMVTVKPRVNLKPFRTFLEVEQPESEFSLRINGNGEIGFFEADGGVWKLEAKRNTAKYFVDKLSTYIGEGNVRVIM